jgi:predicted nucleotidyltransferase
MTGPADEIEAIIGQEIDTPVPAAIQAVAEAARERHRPAVAGILFYGSCLTGGANLDGVVDLYLLVESYAEVYRNPLLRVANATLPPNVFYIEIAFAEQVVRAKYAILSLTHLERLVSPRTLQSYFWSRFAQPVRLVWARDAPVRARVTTALSQAVATTAQAVLPLLSEPPSAQELFRRAFQESYRTELRSERANRSVEIYDRFAQRYDRLAALLLTPEPHHDPPTPGAAHGAAARWRRRRWLGKLLSVLRLMKGAFTFKDGASYLLWKIERHSGVRHNLTPWQRRHPILASSVLFWRLYRKGAFR